MCCMPVAKLGPQSHRDKQPSTAMQMYVPVKQNIERSAGNIWDTICMHCYFSLYTSCYYVIPALHH